MNRYLPLLALASLAVGVVLAQPAAGQGAPAPGSKFSHDDWATVLAKYVDGRGRVNYAGLAKDRGAFDRYIASVEKASPKSNPALFPTRNDALAYYLNAYNAMTFKGVLARLPDIDTVWTPFGTGYSFFVGMDIKIGGTTTNLKKLEDDIVRAEFQDPRIHAALNCASIGCPALPAKPFEPMSLDAQLDAEMSKFANEARNVLVDRTAKTAKLSKIFDWFADDFLSYEKRQGNASPNILDYVNRFRPADQKIPRDFAVSYLDYDKGLNKQ